MADTDGLVESAEWRTTALRSSRRARRWSDGRLSRGRERRGKAVAVLCYLTGYARVLLAMAENGIPALPRCGRSLVICYRIDASAD